MCVLTEVPSHCNSFPSLQSLVLFFPSFYPLFFNPHGSSSVLESFTGLRGFQALLCLLSLLWFSSPRPALPESKPCLFRSLPFFLFLISFISHFPDSLFPFLWPFLISYVSLFLYLFTFPFPYLFYFPFLTHFLFSLFPLPFPFSAFKYWF